MKPKEHVSLKFVPTESDPQQGDIQLTVRGLWVETIVYEVPLLALTSEAYFRWCDRDWDHKGQEQRAYQKCKKLLRHGCSISEFGTRRRRDYHTQDLVMKGLCRAAESVSKSSQPQQQLGKLSGTSNVHFAMKYGLSPVGTVAHEWVMGIAAITDDYVHANELALQYWVETFGEGV